MALNKFIIIIIIINSLETVPANVFSKVTSLFLILKGGELLEESGVPPAAQDGKE